MSRLRKELLIAAAVLVPIFVVVLLWRPTSKISFFDLRVVNDTNRTVTVQPCWDLDCIDIHGLPASVLRPGRSAHTAGHFPTDVGHEIVVGIRKRGGKPWEISSCMVAVTAPGQLTGLVRVSRARACFTATEP